MFDAIIPLKTFTNLYSVTRFDIWTIKYIMNGNDSKGRHDLLLIFKDVFRRRAFAYVSKQSLAVIRFRSSEGVETCRREGVPAVVQPSEVTVMISDKLPALST
jgi:hypothetical protein